MKTRFNFASDLLAISDEVPNKIAIIDDTRSITYRDFRQAVLRAATNLWQQGLRPGDRYIIMMPDCIEWQATFLGGIYLGAIPVLLPGIALQNQCKHVANLSQAVLMVCKSDNNIDLSETNCVKFSSVLADTHASVPDIYLFDPSDPGLWLSSSGTSGNMPKSVVHPHSSLQASVDMLLEFFGNNANNCVFSTAKMSFTYGLFKVLYGIAQTATVVLTSQIPAARIVCNLVNKHKVTQLFSTPNVMLGLSKLTTHPHALDTVDILVTAGEVLNESIEHKILEIYGKRIYNAYGMSESSITITGQNHKHNKFQTIGVPFPGVKIKILDDNYTELSPCNIGEITVHTPARALYYYNEPTATAEAFTSDGWYRSNDLGYIDSDGMICYVGRKNDCFKINSMFVAPTEVENAILKYPGILDCMVASAPRHDGKLTIVANIVLENLDSAINPKDIRIFLAQHLENYKIPSIINFVDEIPKTPTTKKIRSKIIC